MLEYCWLFALLLRSARYFPGVEGKWTPLPPMLPTSCLLSTLIKILKIIIIFKNGSFLEAKKRCKTEMCGHLEVRGRVSGRMGSAVAQAIRQALESPDQDHTQSELLRKSAAERW